MPFNRLSTTKIAKAAGCHPNTVRLYEKIGFLSAVARSPKGYRLYEPYHQDQMCLARAVMVGAWPGRNIRYSAVAVIKAAVSQDYPGTLELAHHHLGVVRLEREQAETAIAFLESWVQGDLLEPVDAPLQIGQAARLLHLTCDVLRNWERSGLLRTPRNPQNRYRLYRSAEIGRLRVIRMLRQAGYSPMAILRMLLELERGQTQNLGRVLDTPRPDEDIYMAADQWLSTLADQEQRAQVMITMVEEMVRKYAA